MLRLAAIGERNPEWVNWTVFLIQDGLYTVHGLRHFHRRAPGHLHNKFEDLHLHQGIIACQEFFGDHLARGASVWHGAELDPNPSLPPADFLPRTSNSLVCLILSPAHTVSYTAPAPTTGCHNPFRGGAAFGMPIGAGAMSIEPRNGTVEIEAAVKVFMGALADIATPAWETDVKR